VSAHQVTRGLCKEMHERFIVPLESTAMSVIVGETQVELRCEDGAYFSFPKVRGRAHHAPLEVRVLREWAAVLLTGPFCIGHPFYPTHR
jgi:hypothetical protein